MFRVEKNLLDNFNKINPLHRAFFARKPVFNQFEKAASTIYKNSIIRAGACIPKGKTNLCEAVLPDFMAAEVEPLTMAKAAKRARHERSAVSRGSFESRSSGPGERADCPR